MKASIILRLPEDLKAAMQDCASRRGMSFNSLVLNILWDWVKIDGQDSVKGGAKIEVGDRFHVD